MFDVFTSEVICSTMQDNIGVSNEISGADITDFGGFDSLTRERLTNVTRPWTELYGFSV